jgi:hypothetical protein
LLKHSIRDIQEDHEAILRRVFANLEPPFDHLRAQLDWAIAQGYLRKGVQETLWGRTANGEQFLLAAKDHHATVEPPFLDATVAQLLLIRQELDDDTAEHALENLAQVLPIVGDNADMRHVYAVYNLNRAFAHYRGGQPSATLRSLGRVARYAPEKLINRGAAAIAVKSLLNLKSQPKTQKDANGLGNR